MTSIAAPPILHGVRRRASVALRWLGLPIAQVGLGLGLAVLGDFGDRRLFHAVLVTVVTIAIAYHVRNMLEKRHLDHGEHRAMARLAESEAHLGDLVDRLPAAIFRDRYRRADGAFVAVEYISPQMEALTGYAPGAFLADSDLWIRMVHPDDIHLIADFDPRDHFDGASIEREYRILRRDGREIWVREDARIVNAAASDTILCHGILTDITDRKVLERQLNHLAFHDPLTGLPNRGLLEDRLAHALSSRFLARRTAVVFLDLDGFKGVNDSLGHAIGDQLLRMVAHRLTAAVRPSDTVARLGGDEFAILLEDVNDASGAARAVERVVTSLRQPIEIAGRRVPCQASLGIAMAGEHGTTPADLLRNADWAMYAAKTRRRGSWMLFEPAMHREAVDRFDLASELRQAVEAGDLTVAYQPIVSLATGAIVGAEALCRWQHPTRGQIPPTTFIDLAEEIGLIGELGHQVLLAACRQATAWRRTGMATSDFCMQVNVSTRQLSETLPAEVATILEATGLPARNLVIEITESAVMHDPEAVVKTLDTLRAMGVAVAMDDFGTGYSSLSHLRTLPLDAVKIDRSFVAGIEGAIEIALIRSVIALAEVRGLETVAEGVETSAQADMLTRLGCHYAQGYLFGRPVPAAAFPFEQQQPAAA